MAGLRIELLGGFRVTAGSNAVPAEAWNRRKPAAVVKLLALAPGHRLHREQLMDALWPELDAEAAAANLRKAVHYARRALGDEGARSLAGSAEQLTLPDDVEVDVDEFRGALLRARRTADVDEYERAIDIYREGLLPEDRYDDWAIDPRDELAAEFAPALEELAALLEARGDVDRAAHVVRRLVAEEPLREDAYAWLMRLHALAGRRGEALRTYEQLQRALGAEPSVQSQRLYEEIRAKQEAEPELTSELWERVGDLRVVAGDTAGAARAYASAHDAAPTAADSARVERKTAGALLMQHDPEAAEPHLAAAEVADPDAAERARLVCLRANQAWERGDFDAAERLAEEAHALALEHGDDGDVAAAREAQAIVAHFRGEWRRGVELQLANGDGQLARVFDIHHCIGQYHLYGDGLTADVEEYARGLLQRAEQAEAARAQAFAWCLLGEALLLRARWDEAAGCLERSCELHASFGASSGALPWQRLAELTVCRGAADEADGFLRRAAAIATVSPMARHLWGRIYATAAFAALERGNVDAALSAVRSADAAAARYGDCPSCSALLNPIAAEAFAAVGDSTAAKVYADAAAQVGGMFDSSAWRAMAETAAGYAAGPRGRFERAAELYDRALQPYWAERARKAAGGTLGERPAS